MRTMMAGLTGWIKMEQDRSEAVRTVDTSLTFVATLLLAAGWALLHSVR